MVDYLSRPICHDAFFKKYANKKFMKCMLCLCFPLTSHLHCAPRLTPNSLCALPQLGEAEQGPL